GPMQVASINDVKIYNLSAGKSIPEWMSSEARRRAERKSIDVRRRIQLIQDFEMPDVSHTVNVSRDGRYVFATGTYKSWLKCYDLENLALKFQRGLDAAVIKMIPLSDDYSKLVLLQEDRFLEMHAAFGRYFRMRMPRFGRDMAFSIERSDLFLVGASSEVYRLNLELGEWLAPLQTNGSALNCCQFADAHQLFVCGTTDGQVEAWDHRDRSRVGILDCLPYVPEEVKGKSEITSLKFRDALRLGVGTSTGQVMLYDIRSRKPLIVKDHMNDFTIKKIDFAPRETDSLVLSMDGRVLKMWNEMDGKPFAAIETEHALNDFCRYPDSGLIFMANEAPRMLQFFIPSIGTAPKWCSYLEALTEELEETQSAAVYDDYKFVTKEELEQLSLSHLIGSSVLRAYMHGYFLDRRLYDKAQLITQPFAYEKYKNRKVQDIMHQERENRVIKSKSEVDQPKVNKELAARLRAEAEAAAESAATKSAKKKKNEKKKATTAAAILQDDRFKKLFADEDFEVDQNCELFKRNIAIQHKENAGKAVEIPDEDVENKDEEVIEQSELPDIYEEAEGTHQRIKSAASSSSDSGSETDEETLPEKKKREREKARRKQERLERQKQLYEEKTLKREAERAARLVNKPKKFVLHELDSTESARRFLDEHVMETAIEEESSSLASKKSLLQQQGEFEEHDDVFGGRSITFNLAKRGASAREAKAIEQKKKHKKERREIVRTPTLNIKRSLKRLPGNLSKP
uniref:NUC153 domain-containing protein n=2 Tax=Haemonchus contortus TaxID=6289 RepID=A0A7I4YPP1_HAECO